MTEFLLALVNIFSVTGFEVIWSVQPVMDSLPGIVEVELVVPEDDLLFVRQNGSSAASWEAIASLDSELFSRLTGEKEADGTPLEIHLEIGDVVCGIHDLSVSLTDLETARRYTWQERIEVFRLQPGWQTGDVQIPTGRVFRSSENFTFFWDLYPPVEESFTDMNDSLQVAFAVRNRSGRVLYDGYDVLEAESERIRISFDIDLSYVPAGQYQLLTAALVDSEIVAASSTDFRLLKNWDVWGENAEETPRLIRSIALPSELGMLHDMSSPEERGLLMQQFWSSRDPDPMNEGNEFLETYLQRLDYVAEHFSVFGSDGVDTDQGRIYLLLGEPDEKEDYPFENDLLPYQIWTYYSPYISVVFVDYDGYGVYQLHTPWEEVMDAYRR